MDAALDWFFQLKGEPDNNDLKMRFEAWRVANSVNEQTFDAVAEAWAIPEAEEVARSLAERIRSEEMPQPTNVVELKRASRVFRSWVAAAAAVILLTVGYQQYPALRIQWEADYVTAAGAQREVVLPDGSKAVLNTDTAIALDFEGIKRSVRLLKGEAYFDVVHDASRPFDVAAAFSQVEVKGTAFSVRRDDDKDAVALERGHVEVRSLSHPGKKVDLQPGQAIVASASTISAVQAIDSSVRFAWLKGQIAFQDQPFKTVLNELQRYYGHSVVRTGTSFDDVKVNGRYRIDNPELAIRSLATTVGASVTRLPGGILILR
ncbi:FecR domain-containing protein [Ensifer adhaerens]|nr:FecR domain-containing protein [Ensifer adhaerens]UAY05015.1 FecR domain-containing protein [Ensifer adhaerens]UAY12435.1 FecR domain-containing protein [Ensifer adhaerens]